jgi:site-specific DNA-cytosine methylase
LEVLGDIQGPILSPQGPPRFSRWNPKVPGTLKTMLTKGFTKGKKPVAHWSGQRQFTIQELGMLQGFWSGYVFKGSDVEKKRQIGNAVPPVFWQYVVSEIMKTLLDWKEGRIDCEPNQIMD